MKEKKDYLNISKILDMSKYTRVPGLRNFKDKCIFIISAKSIERDKKEGFKLEIQKDNDDNQIYTVNTFSKCVVREIKDLLLTHQNIEGKFNEAPYGTVKVEGFKGRNGEYMESFKLI